MCKILLAKCGVTPVNFASCLQHRSNFPVSKRQSSLGLGFSSPFHQPINIRVRKARGRLSGRAEMSGSLIIQRAPVVLNGGQARQGQIRWRYAVAVMQMQRSP